ncbi:EthD domain-containing protein [Pseudomonas sp. PB120]|uniref:EthD domain-containing protein n=1 Tax=Pseudomonas sp. PB120 TaxID=2494700 RepID=UPI0015B68046|nr:EthD domain-containing protein [Pseudomonas sp. PB120]
MYKCIALLKKRADLSRDQLIDYYENNHAPLIKSLFPGIKEYRRNFLDLEGAFLSQTASIDFDVVTEIWFEDRAAYDVFIAENRKPDVARRIAEDELNVFDRNATRMFVVEEKSSPKT